METTAEYKVEVICADDVIRRAVKTLLAVHPYEEPAYEVYPILTLEDLLTSSS